jgi:hypothetical protein
VLTYQTGDESTAVIEKVFPVYSLSIGPSGQVTPGAGFRVDTSLPDGDIAALECVVVVERCDNVGGCCPGADPTASLCACPVVDAAARSFALPRRSGSYSIEGRVLSPRRPLADPATDAQPRPGRVAETFVTVADPAVSVREVIGAMGPTGQFCFHGTAVDGSAMPAANFHPQTFDGSFWVDAIDIGPAGCPDAADVGSFTDCFASSGGPVHVRVNATDHDGNTNDVVLFNQPVPGCSIF